MLEALQPITTDPIITTLTDQITHSPPTSPSHTIATNVAQSHNRSQLHSVTAVAYVALIPHHEGSQSSAISDGQHNRHRRHTIAADVVLIPYHLQKFSEDTVSYCQLSEDRWQFITDHFPVSYTHLTLPTILLV